MGGTQRVPLLLRLLRRLLVVGEGLSPLTPIDGIHHLQSAEAVLAGPELFLWLLVLLGLGLVPALLLLRGRRLGLPAPVPAETALRLRGRSESGQGERDGDEHEAQCSRPHGLPRPGPRSRCRRRRHVRGSRASPARPCCARRGREAARRDRPSSGRPRPCCASGTAPGRAPVRGGPEPPQQDRARRAGPLSAPSAPDRRPPCLL